jgi:hypothetical protein
MLTASTRYPAFNLPFMSFQDNKQEWLQKDIYNHM